MLEHKNDLARRGLPASRPASTGLKVLAQSESILRKMIRATCDQVDEALLGVPFQRDLLVEGCDSGQAAEANRLRCCMVATVLVTEVPALRAFYPRSSGLAPGAGEAQRHELRAAAALAAAATLGPDPRRTLAAAARMLRCKFPASFSGGAGLQQPLGANNDV